MAVATLLILPLYLSYWICSRLGSADSALESHSQCLSLFPGSPGNYLRLAFYRLTLEQCDPTATICFGVLFSKTKARIGQNVYIGPRSMLGWVTLEDDVLLGPGVQIPSGPHTHGITRLDTPIRNQPGRPNRVSIGRDSWIGAGCIVLADVGENSVVGANSTVTKPVPPTSIYAGSPAQLIAVRETSQPDVVDDRTAHYCVSDLSLEQN